MTMKNLLSKMRAKMKSRMGETVDDEIRYALMAPVILKAMPAWVLKLSNKRQDELTRSWYKFYKHLELL